MHWIPLPLKNNNNNNNSGYKSCQRCGSKIKEKKTWYTWSIFLKTFLLTLTTHTSFKSKFTWKIMRTKSTGGLSKLLLDTHCLEFSVLLTDVWHLEGLFCAPLGRWLTWPQVSPLSQLLDKPGTYGWFHPLPWLRLKCRWLSADSEDKIMGEVFFLTPGAPPITSWKKSKAAVSNHDAQRAGMTSHQMHQGSEEIREGRAALLQGLRHEKMAVTGGGNKLI